MCNFEYELGSYPYWLEAKLPILVVRLRTGRTIATAKLGNTLEAGVGVTA